MNRVTIALAVCAWLASSTGPARADGTASGSSDSVFATLMESPVRVTVRAVPNPEILPGKYEVVYRLEHGGRCLEVSSYEFAESAREAVDPARNRVGWKGDHLFVVTECEGGNHWKCGTEEVFSIHSGRLTALGSLGGLDDPWGAPGRCYRDGIFQDLDADLEATDLTSHGGAPVFTLALRDVGGRLEGDLERTWVQNQQRFRDEQRQWMSLRDSAYSWRVDMIRVSTLYGNAALAKYCDKRQDLDAVLAEAKRVLDPRAVRMMLSELEAIRPGALPRRSLSRSRECTPVK